MVFYKDRHTAVKMAFSLLCFMLLIICFTLVSNSQAADNGYERPGQVKASVILKPELLKGKYHTVLDQVVNDGMFNHYTVESPYGNFKADSTSDLEILVREINAIAAMKVVETDDTALTSLKQSGENTAAGIKNLFSDPQGSMKGAASGVGSLFNRVKGTVGKREVTEAEDSRLEQLIGVSKSKGAIATKYGVNVYSRNQILQKELDRLGQADFLGGLGVGVATSLVPGVGGLVLSTSGTARLLNEAINTTPAAIPNSCASGERPRKVAAPVARHAIGCSRKNSPQNRGALSSTGRPPAFASTRTPNIAPLRSPSSATCTPSPPTSWPRPKHGKKQLRTTELRTISAPPREQF